MSTSGLLCLMLMVLIVDGESYNCSYKYSPINYIGFHRVPTNGFTETPSYCPRSWKAGIPESQATHKPLIYPEFITCHENFTTCGYVPIDPNTGLVLGNSGVTIGGVDLGSISKNLSLPIFLQTELEPYFGLRKNLAACAAIQRPLNLSLSETTILTNAVKESVAEVVRKRYDNDKKEFEALPFLSLPRGIRTAIVSIWFQLGDPSAYPSFWNLVRKNDWEGAVKELRNFYKNPENEKKEDLRRRNDEADIIRSSFVRCNRSIDAVVLLDESGSVSDKSFSESLDFVERLITAFPDEKLSGNDSTRFGLSTFGTNYHARFYLSSYTSQAQYKSAIRSIRQARSDTRLGQALDAILVDQFTEERGLRNEEHGFPRVLVVLTDGISADSVTLPAQRVRDQNIVIYAIGIGNYNFFQLVSTLSAATCNEPQPISLNKIITSTTKKNEFQYFLYKFNINSNLEMAVNDISGETFVYASRSNPHPYEYDNDIGSTSNRKNKVIVIAGKDSTIEKTVIVGEDQFVYVSITANTEIAKFTLEGHTCNPLICIEGTNENDVVF